MKTKKAGLFAAAVLPLLAVAAAVGLPEAANAENPADVLGIAIDGYDPVAYFTQGRALQGSETYTYYWNDAEWRFISAEHRDLFAADPKKYAPRHGGF